ncbi:MAG: RIP metalloprotease RseP [Sutterellaceae bacterium]|nr:RIP metalloprotease RseP [Burkholderiaceae bacterium]MDW8429650.1 RIP metalloprotease RseP [Sutterellaceae bacterium]
MTRMLTVVAFLLALAVLIVVHEFGHYYVARRCGVKVLRFSVGFGRPLWRTVAGADRTEWIIGAIPLGGYVRMLDERDTDAGPIAPEDLPRAFNRQPVGKRIAIVAAGPLANLLLAVLLYWGLNVAGTQEPSARLAAPAAGTPAAQAGLQAGDRVTAIDGKPVRSFNDMTWLLLQRAIDRRPVSLAVERGGDERIVTLDLGLLTVSDLESNPLPKIGVRPYGGPPYIGRVSEGSAASTAGLRAGDRVLAIDGQHIDSAAEFIEQVRAAPQRSLHFLIERAGVRFEVQVLPAAAQDEQGRLIGRIGAEIGEQPQLVTVHYGLLEGLARAVAKTWDTAVFSLRVLVKMALGEASLKNLSGPVTIADYAGQTARMGAAAYLSFLALVSISLGVLNLLPIPLLDGGHLVYYAIEIVKGSPPAEWVTQWGQRVGIGVLVLLTALALYNDLTRLLL